MDDEYGWGRPGFLPGVIVIAALGLVTAYAWFRIPSGAAIVTQVDFEGRPSNAQSKDLALLIGPVILVCMAPLLEVVPFIPIRKKRDSDKGQYNLLVWYALLVVIPAVQVWMIVNALRGL